MEKKNFLPTIGYYYDVAKGFLPSKKKAGVVLGSTMSIGVMDILAGCGVQPTSVETSINTVPGREADVNYLAVNEDIDVIGWGANVPSTGNPPGGAGCTLNTGLPNAQGGFSAIGWEDCDSFAGPRGASPVKWPVMRKVNP